MPLRREITCCLVAIAAMTSTDAAAQTASEVFESFSGAVAKVEVLETITSAPTSVGTAFSVAPDLLVTNYHVVRDAVHEPNAYRLSLLAADDVELAGPEVVALDPVNDLALVRVSSVVDTHLTLYDGVIAQGETLYSMGHPRDLNTAVVEGVYNGPVEAAVAPMLLFSGSINPGMSGGPAVREDGTVVGVNVATAGNQLSFIVPADRVADLLEETDGLASASLDDLLAGANRRLTAFQDDFFGGSEMDPLGTVELGRATAPAPAGDQLNCEAFPHEIEDDQYELTEYACYVEDQMQLGPKGSYDLVYMEHMWMSGEDMSVLAFHTLMSEWYTTVLGWEAPVNEDATEYECRDRNVHDGLSAELLVTICARGLKSHPGLYDLFVRSALLGGGTEAVVSTLRAAPISWPNAMDLSERWLETLTWTR